MTLYAVTLTAVYDHGLLGVFTTEESAIEAIVAAHRQSDGHHAYYVEVVELDQPIDRSSILAGYRSTPTKNSPHIIRSWDDDAET